MNDKRATVCVRLNLDADCYELAVRVWRYMDMKLDFYEFLALELQVRLIELSSYLEKDEATDFVLPFDFDDFKLDWSENYDA